LVNAMSILKRIVAWIRNLFSSAPLRDEISQGYAEHEAPALFPSITFVDKPPRNEDIADGRLYCVTNTNKPRWCLFKCPCGCGNVVTLSLQPVHRPHWQLSRTHTERPTLYPSVWRDKGCFSHFCLHEGRVQWCLDTGTNPSLRRSD